MKTWKGICLDDHVIEDQHGARLELKRGHEYDLSHERNGQRCVFANYWVWVPSEWFAGLQPGYG